MIKYSILCLTDHVGHSKENSLYSLINGFLGHSLCSNVVVASRSNPNNAPFFIDKKFDSINGIEVDQTFSFETNERLTNDTHTIDTAAFNILFLRLPRPISDDFLLSLEAHFSQSVIINTPSGIVATSTKAVLLNFQDVCPPIKLCQSVDDVLSFASQFPIVLKPLKAYGGKGILRLIDGKIHDGINEHDALSYWTRHSNYIQEHGYLAMKYLKNVNKGDKRLLVVDGEILASSLRLPAPDSWLCNVAMGGTSVSSQPDAREIEIISRISPYLRQQGILIYGADTLVGDDGHRTLSEINTLSIGGFPQAEKQTGKPIIQMTINKLIKHADECFSG